MVNRAFGGFRPPAGPPTFAAPGVKGSDTSESFSLRVRSRGLPTGPATTPEPGMDSPVKDAYQLVDDIIGDMQATGETIMDALDAPFGGYGGQKGPHRIVDAALDVSTGAVRGLLDLAAKKV